MEKGHGAPHTILDNVFLNLNGMRMIREALGDHYRMIKVRSYFNSSIVKYVLKYVKKAIVVNETRDGKRYFTNDTKKVVHASLYWITGCRMFSMSKTLQKEINKDNDKKEKKERKGEYVATIPNVVREPYPYGDDCPDSIEFVLLEPLHALRKHTPFCEQHSGHSNLNPFPTMCRLALPAHSRFLMYLISEIILHSV